ncbi:uncharacterized protein LOC106873411 [Octopus bimaculoides]|uniref:uncharacterized protein LOC106873411 n=1 Tax=Octopus bimaculoides TaxID=37653 RepID=UPI00071C4B4E|nr:uncharacterized protein LOC106873411 [Octopus bimaculoides]|eukprot:XP_014776252.1 PREDICTED: uncharacterized protein LOC106873411 [Octopus bimaculoides]
MACVELKAVRLMQLRRSGGAVLKRGDDDNGRSPLKGSSTTSEDSEMVVDSYRCSGSVTSEEMDGDEVVVTSRKGERHDEDVDNDDDDDCDMNDDNVFSPEISTLPTSSSTPPPPPPLAAATVPGGGGGGGVLNPEKMNILGEKKSAAAGSGGDLCCKKFVNFEEINCIRKEEDKIKRKEYI